MESNYPPLRWVEYTQEAPKSSQLGGLVAGSSIGLVAVLVQIWSSEQGLISIDIGSLGRAAFLLLLAGLLPAALLSTLLHELAHVAGGWLAGFRCLGLIWGPVQIKREAGGRLSLTFGRNLGLAGGMALCVPESTQAITRRTAILVGMGPAVSVLGTVGGYFLLIGLTAANEHAESALLTVLAAWTAAYTFVSMVVSLASLFPFAAGGLLSDGARLLQLAKGGRRASSNAALMGLAGLVFSPKRPREWPTQLVSQALEAEGYVGFVSGAAICAYYHSMDRGETEAGHRHLQKALDLGPQMSPSFRGAYALEAAFYEAVFRRDAKAAREWMKQARGQVFADKHLSELVEAVLEHLEEGGPAGRKRLRAALEQMPEERGEAMARKQWTQQHLAEDLRSFGKEEA